MKVLVTGANGFIGSNLCRKLIENDFSVKAFVRKNSDISKIKDLPIRIVYGALDDKKSLREAVKDTKIIFHLAAVPIDWGKKYYFRNVNVKGTKNLLDVSLEENVKHFVYVSSVVVESFSKSKYKDDNFSKIPTSFNYVLTKFEAEKLVMNYHKKDNILITIVRPCTVFGPGNPKTYNMLKSLKSGKMIYMGKGDIFVPYSYVDNLADALILAGTKDEASGKVYTVTDEIKITQKEFYEKICDKLGINLSNAYINIKLAYFIAWFLENIYKSFNIKSKPILTLFHLFSYQTCCYIPIDKKLRELGYDPKVNLDEAIDKCIEWYEQENQKNNF